MVTPIIRPKNVFGYSSPYPALVRVMTMFHMQLFIDVKSYPEASERGDSNSLSIYPSTTIETPRALNRTGNGFYWRIALRANIASASQPWIAQTR